MRSLLLIPALALLASHQEPRAQEFSFGVPRGERVEKLFEGKHSMSMLERTITINGDDLGDEEEGLEIDFELSYEYRFADEYREVDADRPTLLAREFQSLARSEVVRFVFESEREEQPSELESELENKSVLFTWDEDGSEYNCKYDGEEQGDADLLEELAADTDFLGFLPGKAVEVGDSWKVDDSLHHQLVDPGGDVHLRSDDDDDDELDDEQSAQYKANFEGELNATFAGTRELDGLELAVIELRGEGASFAILHYEDEDDDPVHDRYDLEVEYEGELLWDPKRGRPHSYSIEGSIGMTNVETTTWYDEDEGADMSLVMSIRLEGTLSHSGTWRSLD